MAWTFPTSQFGSPGEGGIATHFSEVDRSSRAMRRRGDRGPLLVSTGARAGLVQTPQPQDCHSPLGPQDPHGPLGPSPNLTATRDRVQCLLQTYPGRTADLGLLAQSGDPSSPSAWVAPANHRASPTSAPAQQNDQSIST